MPGEPVLALAVSARDWPDRLRQMLADHGGARVRLTALGSHDLVDEEYDVLFVDDICSFLTRGLVTGERERGHAVVGVFDPAEPAGRAHLVQLGVDAVVEASAPAERFVEVAAGVRSRGAAAPPPPAAKRAAERTGSLVVVRGISGGVGVSELALGLGATLGGAVVVEMNPFPSLAQRIGLPVHPNLATAVEAVDHGSGDPRPSLQTIDGSTSLLVGVAGGSGRLQGGGRRVVTRLRSFHAWTVVDAGWGPSELTGEADQVVVVAQGGPVGLTRCADDLAGSDLDTTHVVVNRAPTGRFQQAELLAAVLGEIRPRSLTVIPDDPEVSLASWNGRAVRSRRFLRGVAEVAAAFGVAA